MAIRLTRLIKNPNLLRKLEAEQQQCCYCGVLLQETITGKRKAPAGEACSDCYYEKLGKGIEQNPIASGRVRRG
jgi:hypothetical protein